MDKEALQLQYSYLSQPLYITIFKVCHTEDSKKSASFSSLAAAAFESVALNEE